MMAKDFYTAIEDRRSIYAISKEQVVSDEKIQEVIYHAVKHTPSAFNSQSARVVVLLGEQHDKLWDITKKRYEKLYLKITLHLLKKKINAFKSGYGTVLYFEDSQVVEELQENFALYKENFPTWSQQSSGMLQFAIWTALEIEGFGATLQHYNPLIDEEVRKEWEVPENWKLTAQMPFGKPVVPAGEKEYHPLENRVKIYK